MEFVHKSVLLNECIDNLNIKPDGIYVDGTMGGAGHSGCIAAKLENGGRLIAIDQDEDAIAVGTDRLSVYGDKVTIVRSNYSCMKEIVRGIGLDGVDGILLDLGVSSYQLDNPERGFTYRDENAPLDMRMDNRMEMTARDIVNDYTDEELRRIIRNYGEDKFAGNIAKEIVKSRAVKPIETTGELVDIIRRAYPAKELRKPGHPAKKTFQAIRIELNSELKVLEENLRDMVNLLNDGGRICVITFHSLEDRIVKNIFRECENPCICPPDFPVCVCGRKSLGKVISRKPILPSEEELAENKRSQSAKLRVFERRITSN
ncbi:MAG: 16S rRNA (cytosine(1402)-N(4))-methyltransferase RsmH [Lachnospiraceae bacterium]|nr:16S rRNA (cytosine(1402)-N(4))-methyltransferase RsmH [Lachnoclostridium sp.]MDD7521665.1 16S rRNA (cytosine(1402)-N(4))-methyltransferase RsmH [Lachnoclostridium sp.]MDY2599052.1 16S rRNA (cytosine(1402)-N(4))-methyltransferase RsmH [Lachnospiraceae bacterium]